MAEVATARVENVHRDAWRLMWGEYKRNTWLLVAIGIPLFFLAPPVPFIILSLRWLYFSNRLEHKFMRQFATAHGLEYTKSASIDSVSGRLFSAGNHKKVTNMFMGTLEGRPLRLFHYEYTEGSGKDSTTYNFTVCELTIEKTQFPHILLFAPTMFARYGSVDRWGSDKDVRVPIEGGTFKNFALYTEPGYEIEALQIFGPELLAFLQEHAKNFSIEFAGNKVYLYDDEKILNRAKLDELYTTAQKIFSMLAPFLDRLHDDFAALHPYYKKEG